MAQNGPDEPVGRIGHDERELPVSSYVILGLLAAWGPSTPYAMKQSIDGSIGYFWDFPRAQLYVDPERLEQEGLLSVEREVAGRRRRVYSITQAGEAELRRWLGAEAVAEVEMRDTGLLKLFFGSLLETDEVVAMARRERDLHQRRLAAYEAIHAQLAQASGQTAGAAFGAATLKMGLAYERLSIAFWEEMMATPPTIRPVAPNAPGEK